MVEIPVRGRYVLHTQREGTYNLKLNTCTVRIILFCAYPSFYG